MAANHPAAAARAYAAAARIKSLLTQRQRLLQANAPAGAAAALRLAQTDAAQLCAARATLPNNDPAYLATQAAREAAPLAFDPNAEPADPGYAHRLEIIAAAAATAEMRRLIEASPEPEQTPLRHELAQAAANELVKADRLNRRLPPLPTAGWSKRQQRVMETETRGALRSALENAIRANAAYRAAMPSVIMPELATRQLDRQSLDRMLHALNEHTEDNLQVLFTKPERNRDQETVQDAVTMLIYRQTRYLKTIAEPYPEGYPPAKAAATLASALLKLDSESWRYQEPDNRDACARIIAAGQTRLELERQSRPATIAGRITGVHGDVIIMLTVRQATATPLTLEKAAALLQQEATIGIVYDDDGNPVARTVSKHPDHSD